MAVSHIDFPEIVPVLQVRLQQIAWQFVLPKIFNFLAPGGGVYAIVGSIYSPGINNKSV
ncbi:MAG: hypothetical protein ACE5ES_00650 [Candidatus Nanoarchaeia archaeon]